jgi:hypothetical protein
MDLWILAFTQYAALSTPFVTGPFRHGFFILSANFWRNFATLGATTNWQ